MITLRGAEVSEKLKAQVQEGLAALGRIPRLAIVRVGDKPDDISYEKGAVKKMDSFGLEVVKYTFPENISDREFKAAFREINENPEVDGILVLRPLPGQIVQEDIDRMIHPLKDLDGISPVNIAKVFSGDNTGFAPCTAEAVMDILRLNDIPVGLGNTISGTVSQGFFRGDCGAEHGGGKTSGHAVPAGKRDGDGLPYQNRGFAGNLPERPDSCGSCRVRQNGGSDVCGRGGHCRGCGN